jgi:protein-S-isoprenylcysteine O-methyltransferase Ste14
MLHAAWWGEAGKVISGNGMAKMNEELTFKIIFWVELALIIIFNRALPALQAKRYGVRLSPDREAIENEGKGFFAFRVISGILLAAVLVIYSFFPGINLRFQFPLPVGWRWIGVILSVVCLFLWTYSQEILARNWSGNLRIQNEHQLVTSGPYRVMRHPIYTTMILWSVEIALLTANAFFVFFAILVIVWTPPRISKEEKMMVDHFGDAYLAYMKSTGRYFPKFRRD